MTPSPNWLRTLPMVPTTKVSTLVLSSIICTALSPTLKAETEGEHHQPGSTLGLFIGDTTEDRRVGETIGLEFEHRINATWGVGLTAEHVAGDFDVNVLVIPVAMHNGPWKLYAGPGLEHTHNHEHPLFRVGAEYGFHVGDFEISPQIDLDFVDGERLLIFGVVFAIEL